MDEIRNPLQAPTLVSGFCPNVDEMRSMVRCAVSQALSSGDGEFNLAVYADGGRRADLEGQLKGQAPSFDETIGEWVARVLSREEFCLSLEGFVPNSESLSEKLRQLITDPLAERVGVPIFGFEIYYFAGCYSSSPFGLHQDTEHSFLVHLGPAGKEVILWEAAELDQNLLSGEIPQNTRDLSNIRAPGQRIDLGPGDLLIIPEGCFHFVRSQSYSETLIAAPIPIDVERILDIAVRESVARYQHGSEKQIFSTFDSESVDENNAKIERILDDVEEDVAGISLRQTLRSVELRSRSNGYLKRPAFCEYVEPFEINEELQVTQCNYPIFLLFSAKGLQIISRGHERFVESRDDVMQIIRDLSHGRPVRVHDYCAGPLDCCAGAPLNEVVRWLLSVKGIARV